MRFGCIIKKRNAYKPGGKAVKKTSSKKLDQLENKIDKLAEIVADGFNHVNERIDNLTSDVNS